MKRPPGIYALCFLLAWTSVTDLWRWPLMAGSFSRGNMPSGWFDRATVALLLLAPVSGLLALVGIWRLRRWGRTVFGIWALLAALQTGLLLFMVAAMSGLKGLAWVAVGAMWMVALAILVGLWLYVKRIIGSVPTPGGAA